MTRVTSLIFDEQEQTGCCGEAERCYGKSRSSVDSRRRSSSSSSSTLFVGTFCKGRVRSVGSSDICVVCGSLWLVTSSKGGCSPYPQRPQKSEVAGDFSPQARQNGMILSPHSLKNFSTRAPQESPAFMHGEECGVHVHTHS